MIVTSFNFICNVSAVCNIISLFPSRVTFAKPSFSILATAVSIRASVASGITILPPVALALVIKSSIKNIIYTYCPVSRTIKDRSATLRNSFFTSLSRECLLALRVLSSQFTSTASKKSSITLPN